LGRGDNNFRCRAAYHQPGDVEPLAINPVWTAADLHIHSTFGGGPYTPAQLASFLAGKGYQIGYVTDEPAGWGTNAATIPARVGGDTWAHYRDTVLAASTAQVAMFPGAEISASTREREHVLSLGIWPFFEERHNGHALAYGIQNLTGPSITDTFEGRGLRYNWFLPNTLLSNIYVNNSNVSSAAIAHPGAVHSWKIWSPALTSRYDGYELMRAFQTRYDPDYPPIVTWRSELSARLSGTFAGNGFPSARTGSDYGNHWFGQFSHDISYYTFVGLPSRPSDMRQLTQSSVDAALRAGLTVASRLGGVASLRLRNAQGVLQEIGSQFIMPANSTVNGDIVLRAARSGNYRVRLVEDNFRREWALHNAALSAGQTIVIPVRFSFPGGQRFYHVIVEHTSLSANDTIYTSPIFIRQ